MEVEAMFIEMLKGQTTISTEMKVRNELDRAKCEVNERREVRQMRFTWAVFIVAAAALGVNGIEYLARLV